MSTAAPASNPASTAASDALFQRARAVTPGGVNSPVRAFNAVGGTPRFIRSARGAWLTDVDGNEYVDLICSWGPMLLGHAHPEVQAAVQAAVARGTSYGTPTEPEVELAEEIVARTPVERVRFVSSGTEATMSAIRLARGFTGRDVIVKFAGCYHGHVATGEAAGQPDRRHRRLGARRHEPDPLDGRAGDDLLGELDLGLGRSTVRRAAGDRRVDGGQHLGVGVTEQHRPPRADQVDVLVAVDVGQPGARGRADEPGRAADRVERADR